MYDSYNFITKINSSFYLWSVNTFVKLNEKNITGKFFNGIVNINHIKILNKNFFVISHYNLTEHLFTILNEDLNILVEANRGVWFDLDNNNIIINIF